MATEAAHRGHCTDCDGTIEPGDFITLSVDLTWVHEKCDPRNADPLATSAPVCPRCFIAHAGEECW